MLFGDDNQNQSEDYFAHTRMTFGEHIEVLRWHLWRAIVGFLVCLIASFFVGKSAVEFIARPIKIQLQLFHEERLKEREKVLVKEKDDRKPAYLTQEVNAHKLAEEMGLPNKPEKEWIEIEIRRDLTMEALEITKAQNADINEPTLSTFNVQEAFMVYFKVCIYIGLVLGSPWIFWQIWAFIAEGLYPHEKKLVHVYLPFSLVLFLAGVLLCQFVVLPKSIQILLEFNSWMGLEPELRLSEWLNFAIMLPLIFGVSFQTPLVMLFLERLGIFTIETYRSKRAYAWFAMAVVAAIITPTPDAMTLLFMWVPMCGLYELGIFMAWMSPRRPLLDFDVPESEEMVEV